MKAADVDGDGQIDYAEFLAATVQLSTLQSEDNLEKVRPNTFSLLNQPTSCAH